MVVVGVAVGLVGRKVETIRAFHQIEAVYFEGDRALTDNLAGLELFKIRIGAVDAHPISVEQAEAEHEVGDGLLGRHRHVHLDVVAALEDMARLAIGTADRDVGNLDLARAPSAFGGLEPVLHRLPIGHRIERRFLRIPDPGPRTPVIVFWIPDPGSRIPARRRRDPFGLCLGQRVLFVVLDVDDVRGDHALGVAFALRDALVEPVRFVAELLDQVERVRDEQDRLVAAAEFRELVETLVGESLVADRQHFVHQQHFGIDMDRNRESQAHIHARRVGLDRRVDEILHLRKLDDLVEAVLDLFLAEAKHDAVDEDVLAAGDLGVKAGAQFDQRRDAAIDLDLALSGPRDAGHALEQRALAGAVAADHAVGASLGYRKRDVAQGLKRLVRLQIAQQAAVEQRRLERGKLPPSRVAPIDLGDVDDVDSGRHGVRHLSTNCYLWRAPAAT